MSAAMVLFAIGTQILGLPFPLYPPSALLQSLCTPANTRLITPLSIGPCCTLKGKEVLFSLFLFCHPFPLFIPFYNLLSFPFALSPPLTSYTQLFPFWQLYFCPDRWIYKTNLQLNGWKPHHKSALPNCTEISALKKSRDRLVSVVYSL